MELANLNPFIRYAREHKYLQLRQENSRCYDCRLFFIQNGQGSLWIEGKTFDFSNNTAIYLPPKTLYRFLRVQKGIPFSILVFNFDLVGDFSFFKESLGTAREQDFQPERCPEYAVAAEFSQVTVRQLPGLRQPLDRCAADFLTKPPYYREMASAVLKTFLLEMLRERPGDSASRIMEQVTGHIHSHYSDPQLTNEAIAGVFGYHPNYLSQLFKERTGSTLHGYLLHYRIRMAKNLLLTTQLDINTVSWKCGFNSCAYFIKQFHHHTGLTPRQYRKSQMSTLF